MAKLYYSLVKKMAALEVVYKRLQTLGLHDFCLQLHSHRTNKKAVYDEIIRVLDNARPRDHTKDADLTQLGNLRELLNKYANELHTPFGKLAENHLMFWTTCFGVKASTFNKS